MNKFSVSRKAYHELTQIDDSLPRSYLVEGCQATLDERWKITAKTPGNNPGPELQHKDLFEQEIEKHVSKIQLKFVVKDVKKSL